MRLTSSRSPQHDTQHALSKRCPETPYPQLPIDPAAPMPVVAALADELQAPQKGIATRCADPPATVFATSSQRAPNDPQKKPPALFPRAAERRVRSDLPTNASAPPAHEMSNSVRAAVATKTPCWCKVFPAPAIPTSQPASRPTPLIHNRGREQCH